MKNFRWMFVFLLLLPVGLYAQGQGRGQTQGKEQRADQADQDGRGNQGNQGVQRPAPSAVLQVTVLDDAGNVQSGATVKLYLTEEDFRADRNPVFAPVTTNAKGRAMIRQAGTRTYFIRAEKGGKTNDTAGIRTEALQRNRVNKVNIIISD